MKQLDQKAVWFFFIKNITVLALTYGFASFWLTVVLATSQKGGSALGRFTLYTLVSLGIFLIISALTFIWAKLSYHFYRYELTENGFRKEYGVITKKYVTIPYDRIQNVDIIRGILARILGLSDLNIQTAGGSTAASGWGSEGRLPGLSRDVAEQLRDDLVSKTRHRSKDQGV